MQPAGVSNSTPSMPPRAGKQ